MEGFQAKENAFVEQNAKESLVEIRQEIHEDDSRRLEQFFIHR